MLCIAIQSGPTSSPALLPRRNWSWYNFRVSTWISTSHKRPRQR